MFQNNPLLSQLKEKIQQDIPKRQGIVKATDKGYGFLETDKGKRFFIPPNEMKKVLHGDRITAFIRENGDKSTAEPQQLKHSETQEFVAKLSMQQNKITIKPNNALLKGFFKIQGGQKLTQLGYQDGDWVTVKLIKHALEAGNGFLVEVIEKVADASDPFAYRLITVATHKLPNKAPEFNHPWQVIDPELPREDLTKLPFFTIDGINTQDMDDALYIEKSDNGWFLTVAISDPSAYVPEDSDMDAEAKRRGFTLYLPNFNVPMLPRDLSDSLCSLKEGEKRATLCCKIEINTDGEIVGEAQFFAAWMKSHYRLNYSDVSDYLESENENGTHWKPNRQLSDQLTTLSEASLKRLAWRTENNVVFKSQPDYTLKLNNRGEVYEILCEPRRTANRLVEESMIAANICAGQFLAKHKQQGVFNTHSGFASDRLKKAVELLAQFNIESDAETLGTLSGYTKMRQQTALLHNCYLDHRLRKLLAYADTKNKPEAHFTMGVDYYATWTSPIRKYGDLLNHRLIKSVLLGKNDVHISDDIGVLLNEARKSQRLAERDVNNLLYSQYLKEQEQSNWRYKAEIFDIIKAGVRVRIQENGATFFIPSSLLCSDAKDSKQITCDRELGKVMVAEQTELQLGDVIDVILNNVKLETGQLIGRLADPIIIPE
ncbi:exoribonuclease II [Psychromonas sp. psych-6C06]|uniref:exoribonuclease II n=1 Tax=Psychromonas sp. psych-6C06 TaxID=2058089 RepID=UPI000C324EC1|nr:exoribonuclease II [Psychromonas sp. psych-6C06]PKF60403.1 exoribonuclease II [Psychromonas sp. psych-6C06]